MPTDTAPGPTDAVRFVLRGVAWSLGLFGLLRLNWTEAHVLLPLTRLQAAAAAGVFGTPALPVEVTLACSGADALRSVPRGGPRLSGEVATGGSPALLAAPA